MAEDSHGGVEAEAWLEGCEDAPQHLLGRQAAGQTLNQAVESVHMAVSRWRCHRHRSRTLSSGTEAINAPGRWVVKANQESASAPRPTVEGAHPLRRWRTGHPIRGMYPSNAAYKWVSLGGFTDRSARVRRPILTQTTQVKPVAGKTTLGFGHGGETCPPPSPGSRAAGCVSSLPPL